MTVRWAVHGAAGLAKAVLGIDRVPEEVVVARRLECRKCEHARKHPIRKAADGLPLVSWCDICKCLLKGKTANSGEQCPDGRWEAVAELDEIGTTD